MAHDTLFAESVCPIPARILRLTLRPYSLGHEALLLATRSPFLLLNSQAIADLPDPQLIGAVRAAVIICSQTWSENHRHQKWMRLWRWLIRKENYPLAVAEFQNYLLSGRSLPPCPTAHACEVLYGREEDKGRLLGSPLLSQLYNFASDHSAKVRCREPWDASYAFTGSLYFSSLEMEGRARIENAAELEERLQFAKIEQEVAEEESAGKTPSGLATEPPDLSD